MLTSACLAQLPRVPHRGRSQPQVGTAPLCLVGLLQMPRTPGGRLPLLFQHLIRDPTTILIWLLKLIKRPETLPGQTHITPSPHQCGWLTENQLVHSLRSKALINHSDPASQESCSSCRAPAPRAEAGEREVESGSARPVRHILDNTGCGIQEEHSRKQQVVSFLAEQRTQGPGLPPSRLR